MTLEEFHKAHGPAWARITNLPSFTQGMIFLSLQHTEQIKNLTDEQISMNAVTILAELRGRLRMEAELMALPTMEEPAPFNPLREDYVDAEKEAFEEDQRQRNIEHWQNT